MYIVHVTHNNFFHISVLLERKVVLKTAINIFVNTKNFEIHYLIPN